MQRLSYTPGDFELVVRRARTGLGLFTESPIPKGACIIEYKGVELTKEQEEKSRSRYLFEISARRTIDGAPRWNTARYIKNSCRPNTEPNIYKGRVYVHAKRNIKAGEEICYNYGVNYFEQFLKDICACPKCQPAKRTKKAVARKLAVKAKSKAKTKARAKSA